MSTHDVPGANPDNGDELAVGCWAEHDDKSLIFVSGNENSRVIYSVFDMSKDPILEYRDAMPESAFKKAYSWDKKKGGEKWTWHDKTPFPWDRVIKHGATDGLKFASAHDQLSAAARVARSLGLEAREYSAEADAHRVDQTRGKLGRFIDQIQEAINQLRT